MAENEKAGAAQYEEVARGRISEKRNVVVSKRANGGITVAQQLESQEGDRIVGVFLKGAFHVDGVQGLYNMRDALNVAIKALEAGDAPNSEEWWNDEAVD